MACSDPTIRFRRCPTRMRVPVPPVLERPEEETKLDDGGNGDADRFAHYVSRDRIAESKMTGRPVVALCGKVWVPKRDPTHYPVCPDCKRIYDEMMNSSF